MKKTLLRIGSAFLAALFVVTLAFPCFAATPEEEAKAKIVSMLEDVPMRSYVATTSYSGYAFASDGVNLYGAIYRTKSGGTSMGISLDGGDTQSDKTIMIYGSAAGNYNVAWPGDDGKISDYRFGDKGITVNTVTEGFYAVFDTTALALYAMIPLSYFGITSAPETISTYEVEGSWAYQNDPSMWTKMNAGDDGYAVKDVQPTPQETKAKIVSMLADVPMCPYTATTSYKGYAFASDGKNLYGALYRTYASGTAFSISLDGGDMQSEKTICVYAASDSKFNVAFPSDSGKIDDYRFGKKTVSLLTVTQGFYACFDTADNAEYVMIPLSYFGLTSAPETISTYEVESSWKYQNDPSKWTKLNAGDAGYAVKETSEEAKAKIVSSLADVSMRPYTATTSYKGYAFASDGENLYAALYRTSAGGTSFLISLDGGDTLSEKTICVYTSADSKFNVAFPNAESGKINDYRLGDKSISLTTVTNGFFACFDTTANVEYVMIPLSYFGLTSAPETISTYEVESSWAYQNDPSMWTKLNAGDDSYAVKGDQPSVADLNGDGSVDSADITLLLRSLAGWTTDAAAADITGDGKINNRDAVALIRMLAKLS